MSVRGKSKFGRGFEIKTQLDYITQEMYEYESILLKCLGGIHVTDN
jgi:hypothetical protein